MLQIIVVLAAVGMLGLTPANAEKSKTTSAKSPEAIAACMDACRAKNRPNSAFMADPANKGFCRRQCGG